MLCQDRAEAEDVAGHDNRHHDFAAGASQPGELHPPLAQHEQLLGRLSGPEEDLPRPEREPARSGDDLPSGVGRDAGKQLVPDVVRARAVRGHGTHGELMATAYSVRTRQNQRSGRDVLVRADAERAVHCTGDRCPRTRAIGGNDVKNRTIVGLLVVCCAWGAAANAAQPAATTCDRECLRGKVTQLLHALLKHDVSGLPVADTLRVTEDAVEKPLAKVGLVGTVTRLRGFRQDIIDERAGVAGAHVVVEETGAPVMLVVRLKVVADKLTEIELVATRSRAEGLIFNIDGLSAPSAVMNYAPRPGQLATRDEAIKAAMHYPEGLNAAKTFAAVNAPFAPNAYRYENGQVMAGPDCKFAPGCQNISTQSLAIFERLGDVQTRVIAADERMGIVWLRMAWGVRERGGDQLTVWEMFKVYDGQIHAVEAFMRILPVEKRDGGWK